jgi:hypothetical protein
MASRTITSYRPQAAQANKEPPPESCVDLNQTKHPRDEEHEFREVRAHFEIEPLQA